MIKLAYDQLEDSFEVGLITPDGVPWNFHSYAQSVGELLTEYEQALPERIIQVISIEEYNRLKRLERE